MIFTKGDRKNTRFKQHEMATVAADAEADAPLCDITNSYNDCVVSSKYISQRTVGNFLRNEIKRYVRICRQEPWLSESNKFIIGMKERGGKKNTHLY